MIGVGYEYENRSLFLDKSASCSRSWRNVKEFLTGAAHSQIGCCTFDTSALIALNFPCERTSMEKCIM